MNHIKRIIKKILGKKILFYYNQIKRVSINVYSHENKVISIFKSIKNIRVYNSKNKIVSLSKLFENIKINKITNKNDNFYYDIDFFKMMNTPNSVIGNLCLDYSKILNNSLEDVKKHLNNKNIEFYNTEFETINIIEKYIDKIVKLNSKNITVCTNLSNIKNNKASSFQEALQRILFFNMLLWQTNHRLNGLGRLDKILIEYYNNDIESGVLTEEMVKNLLKEFLLLLHKDYKFKSNSLLGDTGQIIELGGIDKTGKYLCNDLTYMFIELMEELKLPDPKVLVRVSKNMPRKLMEKSLECIQTGIGCPLFANDDVIIDKLINFGYDKEDAYNYGTSACWEPYIIGKSSAQNNIKSLNFMFPLNELLEKENLNKITNFEILLKTYNNYLERYVNNLISDLKKITFEQDPFLSLFIDDCIKNGKDISLGGAKYNDFGLTGVALSNVVNSLVNIKDFVFDKNKMTLIEFNEIRKNDFEKNEAFLKKLKNNGPKYGEDDDFIINLSNNIINFASSIFENKKNILGGKYKFGLSSPNYITDSKTSPASFDGRKNGEPFNVHISTDVSNGYTGLINFAGKLDYNANRFNGNVVDFFVTPNFINDNFDKFVDFLMASIKVGFFEMQMNVVSSAKLIEARKNPEKFPNLVVRVWGFSAYFNDLPDDYKDYLIERALKNESHS